MTHALSDLLFGESRYFTLPSGADFLGELSGSLVEVTRAREKPEALSDTLIFVPNRRSARVLAGRLYMELGGTGFLPPDIRPLGDAGDNDPALLGELAEVDVRPPMPNGGRIGVLTCLVLQWHAQQDRAITLASAMSVARDLARLLDQASLSGSVSWEKLSGLVADSELARHWQMSVEFLEIISKFWPAHLEEYGFSDTSEQDLLAAKAMCARWERDPPDTPVFIVGSTGTAPATRLLMAGAAKLPRGCILFPGLDTEVDENTWEAVLSAPSHPQHAFADALRALEVPLKSVRIWPGYAENRQQVSRRKLIQESLAPADVTADWVKRLEDRAAPLSRREMTELGMSGLSLIEAETEAEEADAIALLLRSALEEPGKTAALVTPDAGLARRVSTHMARWGVNVAPSSGVPLLRTPAGGFLLRVLDFILDPGDPLALAALLKHEKTQLGDAAACVSLTERGILRGLRRWDGFAALMAWAETAGNRADEKPSHAPIPPADYAEAIAPLTEIEGKCGDLLSELQELMASPFSLRPFIEKLAEIADALSKENDETGPSMLWSGEDGAGAARFLEDIAILGDWLPDVNKEDLPSLFTGFADNLSVPPEKAGHPGIFIWGPLEARLQSCDLVILGSLNEGVWPEPPGVDGFLPRHMRGEIGLPDTEMRIGLSAHDFAQLACSPDVVLTRAMRVENKPSVASRWLWRLRILTSGALESLEAADERLKTPMAHILDWARAQHTSGQSVSVLSPAPRPPLEARPVEVNVTEVQRLIRDPYAYYAQQILKLSPLEPLNAELGPREIGIAMHKALEDRDTKSVQGLDIEELVGAFETELRAVGGDTLFFAEREGIWRNAAGNYYEWLKSRDGHVAERHFETYYSYEMEIASGRVSLRGRADLIETLSEGGLAITDFKTGKPPSFRQVKTGLEPQLPLLAVIVEKGVSKKGPKGSADELFYFGLGTDTGAKSVSGKDYPVPALMDEAEAGFRKLMESYLQPGQPYLSGPRIQFAAKYSDYDRLSRKKEWADAGAEAGGEA